MIRVEDCLWCKEPLAVSIHWTNVILLQMRPKLCTVCLKQLTIISGERCERCSKQHTKGSCADCSEWEQFYAGRDPLIKNISLYTYNAYIKELVATWKYRGDFVLGTIFKDYFITHFHAQFGELKKEATIIPIPLSDERLWERGFNQADMLASFLPGKKVACLKRTGTEKQSKKTRQERVHGTNPFQLMIQVTTPAILIDDIYTTGSTLRHAANLLMEAGCPAVYAYTLIRG